MSARPTQGADTAMAEAAAWKIRLNDAPHDRALQTEFAAWRAQDARNDRAWRRMERVWAATGALADNATHHVRPATPATSSTGRPRIAATRRWPRRVAACAMVAAAACVGAFATPDLMVRLQADYYTKTGETRSVSLPDGSSVTLAGHSAIALHYARQERGVTLLAGEAFFNVVHDSQRGFSVTADNVTARDIGTAFDIRITGPHVTVAVREGIVSVARQSTPALHLTAGQQWTLNSTTGQAQRSAVDPEDVGAWRSGQMVLNGVPLSEAVEMLGRYYPGIIVTRGLERDITPVGGIYDLHHPKEALEALCALHGGRLVSLPAGFVLAEAAPKAP
ncbi:two component sensor histidine kinase FecR/PupR [Komagataeibacter diospyri]|uniref:FecR family protein n=1 Tax=Komagataeibacter diospyri TaxID=1932662 RepID=UPI001135A56F|nr:FecR domain-containing protein [Komagataeibacter diospyri]GCE88929.1 two component sensor histidine kinase FecR/PupR [Komagataeibacter diospyri]